jgi:hypothetical protein
MRNTLRFSAFSIFLAQTSTMYIYCGGLPGCPSGWTERFSGALTLLLTRLPTYVIALATLFIMIGGVNMIINAGDTEKVTRGKNTIIWAIIGIFVTEFAADFIAYSTTGGTNGFIPQEVLTRVSSSDLVTSVIATLIQSIFILSYVVILGVAIFCGMRMVLTFGKEDEFTKAKEGLFWAAVGAVVINLASAIVNAFATL